MKQAEKRLTADELREFKLRRTVIDHAQAQTIMLRESYNLWLAGIKTKYELTGVFEIDTRNGKLQVKPNA